MLLSFGACESAEFKRQTLDFFHACRAREIDAAVYELAGRNHYAAIEDVVAPGHPLLDATMALALGTASVA